MNIASCHIARMLHSAIALGAFTACGGTSTGGSAAGLNSTHQVGGTVSGLVGQGLTIELLNPATPADRATILEQIDIVANGAFVFRMPPSQGYDVAIVHQPHAPTQRCVVRNGQGVIGKANAAGVNIVCSVLEYQRSESAVGRSALARKEYLVGRRDL
jgi:hypothetical protein